MSDIGGILGMNTACESCIWHHDDFWNRPYSIIAGAENDFDWFYREINMGQNHDNGSMIVFHGTQSHRSSGRKFSLKSPDGHDWRFRIDGFTVLDSEILDGTEYVDLSMAINGIGLPEHEYLSLVRKLYGTNNKIQCQT